MVFEVEESLVEAIEVVVVGVALEELREREVFALRRAFGGLGKLVLANRPGEDGEGLICIRVDANDIIALGVFFAVALVVVRHNHLHHSNALLREDDIIVLGLLFVLFLFE